MIKLEGEEAEMTLDPKKLHEVATAALSLYAQVKNEPLVPKVKWTEAELEFQMEWLEQNIHSYASKGKFEFKARYSGLDPVEETALFSNEFVNAVTRAFKDRHPKMMVILHGGQKSITISWSNSNGV